MTDHTRSERPPFSLTSRLALAVALILLAGGAGVMAAALAYGRQAAQEAYDRLLLGAAGQIAGAISIRNGEPVVDIPVSAFELLALAPDDRVTYRIATPDGGTITGDARLDLPRTMDDGEVMYRAQFGDEPVRVAAVRRHFAERAYSGAIDVMVGHTMRARQELAWNIARNALAVVALAGLMMAALATFAVNSALRPLRRIERDLLARDPHDLTAIDTPMPREVQGLVGALNRFMGRLSTQMDVMSTLIADASHQLRTPVAALRAQAELGAEEEDPARLRAILGRVRDRAVGLSRLTNQLLNRALVIHRADAAPLGLVDLRAIAMTIANDGGHDAAFASGDLRLELPEDAVMVRGDALSLAEAGKNLVNNALRHGGKPVTVLVGARDGEAWLSVRDRGPGLPPAQWADAGKRFVRSSGVSPDSAGLGLAIVAEVARSHGGKLAFASENGFEAALRLPAGEEDAP